MNYKTKIIMSLAIVATFSQADGMYGPSIGTNPEAFAPAVVVTNRDQPDTDVAKVMIDGPESSCNMEMDSTGQVVALGKCKEIVNSKGVLIYCTPKKKMCKTYQEIKDVVFGG